MELEFSTFAILLTSLLFVYTFLKLTKKSKNNGGFKTLPPGPRKLPIIGNMHQLLHSAPHFRLRDLAKQYGPLMHLQIGELSTVVVSSPELAKEVFKTHDVTFASRPYNFVINALCYNSIDIVFSPYGDYWRQLRKICTLELVSTKRVQSFRSVREDEVSDLISWIASKAESPVNLTERIHSLTTGIILRTAFGTKRKDHEVFASVVQQTLDLAGGFSIVDVFPTLEGPLKWITGVKSRLNKLKEEMDGILENIINQHRSRRSTTSETGKRGENEDLVDVLLRAQEDTSSEVQLTTDNIKAVLVDLIVAGTHTSATTIEWALSELIRNPKLMKKAQSEVREVFNRVGRVDESCISEMKYLKAVFKETLRIHSPAPLIPRECREACEINGFQIPEKTRVIINTMAIGRDPEHWSDPESFNPGRFLDSSLDYKGVNFEYIPFGAGRRICPGLPFGVANVELPLAMLLYHFDWKVPSGMKPEDLNMAESFSFAVGRKEDLYLVPVPYHP